MTAYNYGQVEHSHVVGASDASSIQEGEQRVESNGKLHQPQ